jgi:hypothetical protein
MRQARSLYKRIHRLDANITFILFPVEENRDARQAQDTLLDQILKKEGILQPEAARRELLKRSPRRQCEFIRMMNDRQQRKLADPFYMKLHHHLKEENHKDTKGTKKNIKILCALCVFVVFLSL